MIDRSRRGDSGDGGHSGRGFESGLFWRLVLNFHVGGLGLAVFLLVLVVLVTLLLLLLLRLRSRGRSRVCDGRRCSGFRLGSGGRSCRCC